MKQQCTGTQRPWWKQRGGLSAGMKLSCSFSESRAVGVGGRARERQVLQGQSEGGVGGKSLKLQFRTPAFLGSYFGEAELQVWVSEGGWDWRRLGVGVASISKPHLCGSAESSLQVWSQQTVTRPWVPFGPGLKVMGKKKWPRGIGLHSTHISFVQWIRGWFIHCRLLR